VSAAVDTSSDAVQPTAAAVVTAGEMRDQATNTDVTSDCKSFSRCYSIITSVSTVVLFCIPFTSQNYHYSGTKYSEG